MTVVPVVFSSLVVGVAGLGSIRALGRIGIKSVVYCGAISIISVVIALTLVNIIKPGQRLDPDTAAKLQERYSTDAQREIDRAKKAGPALPHLLNPLIRQNRRVMFKLLFESASQTLLLFGRNELKARIGITAVLHTWGQTLVEHYHLHCIVTGGGLALDGSGWQRTSGHFLFPVRALSKVFAGKLQAGLAQLRTRGKLEFHGQIKMLGQPAAWAKLLRKLKTQKPVVYAKKPFAGPQAVLKYLSRYTHGWR